MTAKRGMTRLIFFLLFFAERQKASSRRKGNTRVPNDEARVGDGACKLASGSDVALSNRPARLMRSVAPAVAVAVAVVVVVVAVVVVVWPGPLLADGNDLLGSGRAWSCPSRRNNSKGREAEPNLFFKKTVETRRGSCKTPQP